MAEDFGKLAASPGGGPSGFTDRTVDWRKLPVTLGARVDEFNGMPKPAQQKVLEQIASTPDIAKGVEKVLQPYRDLERVPDRDSER